MSHSAGLDEILRQLRLSVLLTNYQAGGVVAIRADEQGIDPFIRYFDKPMGLAVAGRRLAVGVRNQVWTYYNYPQVAPHIEPKGRHDVCFLPRTSHVTGDIHGHEMAWVGEELWIVNTLYSCLCTLHPRYNFVPRWQPPFITEIVAADRCHLNGLALRDGQIKYITALAETDSFGGWRSNKATSGVVLEYPSGRVVARGLSMPHSPRWHNGQLWVLESGRGALLVVDPQSGDRQTVATVPGFTRGLSFRGPLAFIGLSKMRETALSGGLPIEQQREDLQCGVWIVDTRNGQTVGFFRFDAGVEELFAVEVLPGSRFPEIVAFQKDSVNNLFILPDENEMIQMGVQ
jgi:uncharacterized protein (TIGR03032 family)